jgi:hypothetical protein
MSRLALSGALRYRPQALAMLSVLALGVAAFSLPEVPHATMFLKGFIPGLCAMLSALLFGNWILQERARNAAFGWISIFFAPTPSRSFGVLLVLLLSFSGLLYSQEVGMAGVFPLTYVSLSFVSGCAIGAFSYRRYGPQARWLRIVYHLDRLRLDAFTGATLSAVLLGANFYYLPTQAIGQQGNGAMLFPLFMATVVLLFMLGSGLVAGAQSSKSNHFAWLNLPMVLILLLAGAQMAHTMLPSVWIMNGREYSANGVAWAVAAGIVAGLFAGITVKAYQRVAVWYLKFLLYRPFKGVAYNIILRVVVNVAVPVLPVVLVAAALLFAYTVAGLYGAAVALMGLLSNGSIAVQANQLKPSMLELSMAQRRKLALVSPALDKVLREWVLSFLWNAKAEKPANA